MANILSKLNNKDQIENKLWHFEDNTVSRGEPGRETSQENPEKAATQPFVGFRRGNFDCKKKKKG